MATAAPRTNRSTGRAAPQPGDMTALQKAALEEKADAAKDEAARLQAAKVEVEDYEAKHTVIDYSGADIPLPEVTEDEAELENPVREVIMKYAIDQMAFGREVISEPVLDDNGNVVVPARLGGIRYFTFKEGRRYRLPKALADHLDERGFLFH
jgi:hypothetical protein